MFEEMTYEYLMEEMMADMPDGIDTSEGSLIFNACAKQAVRLEEYYQRLAQVEYNGFVDTADLEHLIKIGEDRGVLIKYATFAEFKAQFNVAVPLGTKFTGDDYNYAALELLNEEQHLYTVVCDTAGADPNHIFLDIYPVEFIDGFEEGKLLECTKAGTDMESTELYRARLKASFSIQGSGGNREYYLSKLKQYIGVGGAKIKRVKFPEDYIDITVISDQYTKPTDKLITELQTYVDPVVNSGEGYGIAPIGHRVTIRAVEETPIAIETTLTYETGFSYEDVSLAIEQAVEEYLHSLCENWETAESLVVRIIQIEAAIITVKGILDITGTRINGEERNLILNGTIPAKGEIICR